MAVYLDCALRDYFNAGGSLRHETQNKDNTSIYVAPLFLVKNSFHKADKEFILNALNDSLTNHYGNLIFAGEQLIEIKEKSTADADFEEYVDAAKNLGCKYVLIRILNAKKIRDAQFGEKLVTLEEIILDENGVPVSMKTSGASTENLTVLEAALLGSND